MVSLTIFWLAEVISLLTLVKKSGPKVGELPLVGRGRCAKRLSRRLCRLL